MLVVFIPFLFNIVCVGFFLFSSSNFNPHTWPTKLDPQLMRCSGEVFAFSHVCSLSAVFSLSPFKHKHTSFVWTVSLCAWHACLAFLKSLSCCIGMISVPERTLPESDTPFQHSSISFYFTDTDTFPLNNIIIAFLLLLLLLKLLPKCKNYSKYLRKIILIVFEKKMMIVY